MIELTYHSIRRRDVYGALVDALDGQEGDAVTIQQGETHVAAQSGLYRAAVVTDSRVRIGDDLTDATGGERWLADSIEVRFIAAGQTIAVGAL